MTLMTNSKHFLGILLLLMLTACKTSLPTYLKAPKAGLPSAVTFGQKNLPFISAHRGGRNYPAYPENSLELFAYTSSQARTIIECDVSMSKDSVLLLMHDNKLDRTTTGTGKVVEKNWSEIEKLHLKDDLGDTTSFKVPKLDDALRWGENKVWFTLDVKRGVPFERVIDAIRRNKAERHTAIITYNLNAAKEIHQLDSTLLISVGIRSIEELDRCKKSGIPTQNLIAFTGTRRQKPELFEAIHHAGIICIFGTLGNIDRQIKKKGDGMYMEFLGQGVDILATDRPVEAYKAIIANKNSKSKNN